MIVRFTRGREGLCEQVMDAVPRSGEGVLLKGEQMTVWNVAWDFSEASPVAWVALKTEQEYNRAIYGRSHIAIR